jgi:mannose-6-phosphate isomerase-like protein (cupin superfamily)
MRTNPFLQDALEDKAVIFKPGDGTVINIKGGSITLKVTSSISNDQLGVYEIALDPGTVGAQLHYHRYMDETFLVNDGTLHVDHGTDQLEAEAWSVIYAPRFTPHGFANNSSKPCTLTLIFNPAQKREGFFFGLAQILNNPPINPEKFLALYNKYDSFPVERSALNPKRA